MQSIILPFLITLKIMNVICGGFETFVMKKNMELSHYLHWVDMS